jgi:hypothetical protein
MKALIKAAFALIAAVLFLLGALMVLLGAHGTPGFMPNSGQEFLLDSAGGGLVAFITAQLGLAIATMGGGLNTFGSKVVATMGSDWGARLLLVDVIIFVGIGLWFVLLWVKPDLIAVGQGTNPLKEAPEYIAAQAKVFVGVILAALAALATSTP